MSSTCCGEEPFYLFIYESGEYIKVKPHFSQGLVPLMHDKRDLGARLAAFYREVTIQPHHKVS
ncbi:hypothetical protein D9546_13425 [Geobacillus stearothermophilus]|nr:hypothetical protein D9546_13425 [Geobacillus stearothermophilus]